MNKTSFLSVYGPAWMEGVSKAHILKSFEKTGVYPFNAAAIHPEQMAPSLEHSTWGNLPLPVPSPVKDLMHVHNQLIIRMMTHVVGLMIHRTQRCILGGGMIHMMIMREGVTMMTASWLIRHCKHDAHTPPHQCYPLHIRVQEHKLSATSKIQCPSPHPQGSSCPPHLYNQHLFFLPMCTEGCLNFPWSTGASQGMMIIHPKPKPCF